MRRGLLIALCVVLALQAGPALAKQRGKKPKGLGPVVAVSATGPVVTTPAGTSTATATCPTGLRALGGGFMAPFGSEGAMVVTSSYRNSPSSWQVAGTLVSGAGSATAYAYCRRKALTITDVVATGTLPSGSGQSQPVEAACRKGAVAISGGFQMTAGPLPGHLPIPEQSISADRGTGLVALTRRWQVLAQNSDTGAQTITAHAYCATGIKRRAFGQEQLSAAIPLFGSLTASSACPPGHAKKAKRPVQRLSAGGFESPFAQGVLPVHTDSRIAGGAFIDTAVNGGSVTGQMTVRSQAICF